MNSNWDDAGSIVIYSSHVTQVLSCWKVFYRVKGNRRLPKFQKQHFCYPAWFSKCNQEDFGLPHLTCQDTEIMSLSSSCMGPPDQGGYHLSRMHCHLRHDPPPYHTAWTHNKRQPCPHQGGSTVRLSWNFRRNCGGVVVHHSVPGPESAPRLIYEPGCQRLLYLYQTSCSGEWELWAQPPI